MAVQAILEPLPISRKDVVGPSATLRTGLLRQSINVGIQAMLSRKAKMSIAAEVWPRRMNKDSTSDRTRQTSAHPSADRLVRYS
jgi:hypothetical protein